MIAEIRGKVNRQNTNITELGKDELTGNFFGNYGYDYEDCFSVNKYKGQYLPWGWDDRERHLDRCWKTSFKIKKQWEKHVHKKRFC